MPDFKNYDHKRYVLVCGGHEVRGFADGTHITLEFDDDVVKKKVGAHGDVVRFFSYNGGAKFTIQLLPTSPSLDFFSAKLAQRRLNQTVSGDVFDVLLKDLNGNTVVASRAAWVMRQPNVEVGDEPPNREIIVDMGYCEAFVGGSLA